MTIAFRRLLEPGLWFVGLLLIWEALIRGFQVETRTPGIVELPSGVAETLARSQADVLRRNEM